MSYLFPKFPWERRPPRVTWDQCIDDINNKATAMAKAERAFIDAVNAYFDNQNLSTGHVSEEEKKEYRGGYLKYIGDGATAAERGYANFYHTLKHRDKLRNNILEGEDDEDEDDKDGD